MSLWVIAFRPFDPYIGPYFKDPNSGEVFSIQSILLHSEGEAKEKAQQKAVETGVEEAKALEWGGAPITRKEGATEKPQTIAWIKLEFNEDGELREKT